MPSMLLDGQAVLTVAPIARCRRASPRVAQLGRSALTHTDVLPPHDDAVGYQYAIEDRSADPGVGYPEAVAVSVLDKR
jgi:hypothetical protein